MGQLTPFPDILLYPPHNFTTFPRLQFRGFTCLYVGRGRRAPPLFAPKISERGVATSPYTRFQRHLMIPPPAPPVLSGIEGNLVAWWLRVFEFAMDFVFQDFEVYPPLSLLRTAPHPIAPISIFENMWPPTASR